MPFKFIVVLRTRKRLTPKDVAPVKGLIRTACDLAVDINKLMMMILIAGRPLYSYSRRGKRVMHMSGYYYTVHYQKRIGQSIKIRWRCLTHYNMKQCKAVIYSIDDVIPVQKPDHNHGPTEPHY
jgi:hypothetical protein